ncbi:MAG: ribonuclease E/G, partial [Pseudomonadota bacterium]|nr:ribonuclease E/G [Pseudomonadota bacterium]
VAEARTKLTQRQRIQGRVRKDTRVRDRRYNRAVEKKMKEALKLDRARVQNNRISQFGLMEISRQRRRAGVLQATSDKCDACDGTGRRRSIPSAALQLLRAVEARAAGGGLRGMTVTAPTDVALYLLNSKRDSLSAIEEEAGYTIAIKSSGSMIPGDFELDADKASTGRRRRKKFNREDFLEGDADDHLLPDAEDDDDEDEIEAAASTDEEGDEASGKRKRRRRGRRGGRRRRRDGEAMDPGAPPSDGGALLDGLAMSISNLLGDEPDELPDASAGGLTAKPVAVPEARAPEAETSEEAKPEASTDEEPKDGKKRRRRRRRRRRGGEDEASVDTVEAAETGGTDASEGTPEAEPAEDVPIVALDPESEPVPADSPVEADAVSASEAEAEAEPETEPEPASEPELVADAPARVTTEPVLETSTKPKKKKRGWWSR